MNLSRRCTLCAAAQDANPPLAGADLPSSIDVSPNPNGYVVYIFCSSSMRAAVQDARCSQLPTCRQAMMCAARAGRSDLSCCVHVKVHATEPRPHMHVDCSRKVIALKKTARSSGRLHGPIAGMQVVCPLVARTRAKLLDTCSSRGTSEFTNLATGNCTLGSAPQCAASLSS